MGYRCCYLTLPVSSTFFLSLPQAISVAHSCSHLKAEATAIEAALVHGRVFADKALAEAALVLEEKVTVVVVVQHAPSQVQQGAQLAQCVAVGFHLPGVVRYSEEDAAAVGRDVAPFLDDVQKAASHNLQWVRMGNVSRQKQKFDSKM